MSIELVTFFRRGVASRRQNVSAVNTQRWIQVLLLAVLGQVVPLMVIGQQTGTAVRDTTSRKPDELTAGEADGEKRPRQVLNTREHDLGFLTFRFGGGLLFDAAGYSQDLDSREQMALRDDGKLRDARFILGGRFKTERSFTWQAGIMWDALGREWLVRQTGLMVGVPEISSHFFIGRAKEGFSLNKVMVGYDGWSMERQPFTDATIPLLADGIKWLGSVKDNHLFWNLGWFNDVLSEGQSFSSYNYQVVLRTGWVPLIPDSAGTLLHIGLNLRRGDPDKGQLRLKSKPESFTSPNFIDTGSFPAESSNQFGIELYYRPNQLLIGTEYSVQMVKSPERGDPVFHGGEFVIAWLTTGETRSYNKVGHYFRAVSPNKTVVEGGPGAWEAVFKFSYANLNDSGVDGGIFWRATPMLNWHLTDNVRLELAYGWGRLDRFGVIGTTRFFQTRIQMQL